MTAGLPRVVVHDESPGLGGALTSVGALAPFLRRSGWQVEVVALQPEGWAAEGIDPHLVPRRGERISGLGYFAREATRALDLVRACRRLQPDVLLANNGPTANLATHLAGRALRLPVVQYVRGPFPGGRLAARILRHASAVLPVGEECAAQVGSVAGLAVDAVGEALDPARWPGRRMPGARDWLWSSALVDWKGLPVLLAAYEELGGAAPPLHVCYADLPARHPDAVAPPGRLPAGVTARRAPQDLDRIRAGCRLYVHTALRPEPFGRAVLEAMGAGLCPVVPDSGTPARLVRHGENGLVYRTGSAGDLARMLRLALAADGLCERLGDRAEVDARALAPDRVFRPVLAALERSLVPERSRTVPIRNGIAPHG